MSIFFWIVFLNKRSAEGLDPERADEPLIHSVQQALENNFSAKYCWQLEPKYQPSNSMLGRILERTHSFQGHPIRLRHQRRLRPCIHYRRAPNKRMESFALGIHLRTSHTLFKHASHLEMASFHLLSRQIISAAQVESDVTTVTSYSAHRLLPSIAELWHLPEAVRINVGGWNRMRSR